MIACKSVMYLASKSASRRQLLQDAQIPFKVIDQDADEAVCHLNATIEQIVSSIARQKMDHVCMADVLADQNPNPIVVTADTLVQGRASGKIFGKPNGYDDAIATLKELRQGAYVATAFCCEKKFWNGASWETVQSVEKVVSGEVVLDISDAWISTYLAKHPCALNTAGVLFLEGYGAQFVSKVVGSYTAILGLPMRELRLALEELEFFDGLSELSL